MDTNSVVFCNICAVGTQTEESKDPDWEEWILNGVVEDVDIDLNDEGTIAEGEYRVCALETQLEEEEEVELQRASRHLTLEMNMTGSARSADRHWV